MIKEEAIEVLSKPIVILATNSQERPHMHAAEFRIGLTTKMEASSR